MIIHLNKNIPDTEIQSLAAATKSTWFRSRKDDIPILVTYSSVKELPEILVDKTISHYITDSDMQLSSRRYRKETREIKIGEIAIGGNNKNTLVITGPCSVESEEQITQSAELCIALGVKVLRAGCYKPRTSPYSFQGMGIDGLKLLDKMRNTYGLKIITEVRDSTHVQEVISYTDIVQIGAKSMYDHGILKACGKAQKPILLKRGFGTTLQEFVQASEFILSAGNEDVILCERGIRTFETKTRFTFDLCGVTWLKQFTNLPLILDPSHAIGYNYGVSDLSRASAAMGIEGLLIETHPNPKVAMSDAAQQLNHEQFTALYASLKKVAEAVDRVLI